MIEERDESLAEELLEKHAGTFPTQLAVAVRFAFDEGLRRREHGYGDAHYQPTRWLSVLSDLLAPALYAAERQGYEAYQPPQEEVQPTEPTPATTEKRDELD